MVNLIEFSLKSDKESRTLFISPGLLQSKEMPSLLPPLKAYMYKNLVKEDWLAHLKGGKIKTPEQFQRERLVVKHDQNFESAYLGCLSCRADENNRWKWEGSSTNLSQSEIEEVEMFLNNYGKNEQITHS